VATKLSILSILIATALVLLTGPARAGSCCPPKTSGQSAGTEVKSNTVLNPSKYFGRAALGYSAAQQAPELCQKLFCYCGCDMTDSHANLLDCFTCDHGADCQICQDEAIIGLHMKQEGKSLYKIQRAIDDAFSQQYPWDKPTAQLTKYRESIKPDTDDNKNVSHAASPEETPKDKPKKE
jgi:Protein of unknown function with PCYCGC motif